MPVLNALLKKTANVFLRTSESIETEENLGLGAKFKIVQKNDEFKAFAANIKKSKGELEAGLKLSACLSSTTIENRKNLQASARK